MMLPFDFQPATRIVFGPDALDRLGELAQELAARRALVVSDAGVIAAGHTPRGIEALAHAGIAAEVFGSVRVNPTTDDVAAGVERARTYTPDLLIGLGGGSSLDCAKGINFIHTNGGQMRDYWGVGKARHPMLPMIAVPTTAGTGSESQSFALISDAQTKEKMACGDKKAACRIALLDPKLTLTQPPRITALTGIDALAHALETYVTKRRNEISLVFSREAWRLLAGNLARVLEDPNDLNARAAMQLGASLAGLAIENSMLGAAHALANPLTAELRDRPWGSGGHDAASCNPLQRGSVPRMVPRLAAGGGTARSPGGLPCGASGGVRRRDADYRGLGHATFAARGSLLRHTAIVGSRRETVDWDLQSGARWDRQSWNACTGRRCDYGTMIARNATGSQQFSDHIVY